MSFEFWCLAWKSFIMKSVHFNRNNHPWQSPQSDCDDCSTRTPPSVLSMSNRDCNLLRSSLDEKVLKDFEGSAGSISVKFPINLELAFQRWVSSVLITQPINEFEIFLTQNHIFTLYSAFQMIIAAKWQTMTLHNLMFLYRFVR